MPPPSSTDREALIAALAQEAQSAAAGEPDLEPEVLLDYLAGRLAPEEEQRVARQLAADPTAARALLDLADLEAAGAPGAGAGERPADLAAVVGWREFRDRWLPRPRPLPHRFAALWPAIAASLLVATVGFGTWAWRLQSLLQRPIANLVTLELSSTDRAAGEPVREIPSGAPLRLVLTLAEGQRCPGDYVAEIARSRGGDPQPIEGLERSEGGHLVALVWLEPGPYRLRLFGCEPRRELAEHRFRITAAGSGGPEG